MKGEADGAEDGMEPSDEGEEPAASTETDVLEMLRLEDAEQETDRKEEGTEPSEEGEDPTDSEGTEALKMLPLEDAEEPEPAKETAPEEETNPAEKTGGEQGTEPEASKDEPGEKDPEGKTSKEEPGEKDSDPNANGLWIYGPEKMKAGSKKYFKARFNGFQPKRLSLTWSLDCEGSVARVYGNGQIWVLPKTAPGTVLTLTCHAEALDADGRPWTGETTMQIEVK